MLQDADITAKPEPPPQPPIQHPPPQPLKRPATGLQYKEVTKYLRRFQLSLEFEIHNSMIYVSLYSRIIYL